MKEIGKRIWNEPAVCIGLLTSLILVFLNVIGDDDWGIDHIVAVLAPFLSSLGIRSFVKPMVKIEQENKDAAMSKLQSTPATDAERHKGF